MNSTILVVEDNQKILFNLKLLLKHKGYKSITATNGVEALEILSNLEKAPDLILCDIMMPKMDGYEFYQKVSENPDWISTPFIFISAKTDPEDVRLAMKLGIDDYIKKPFNKEDLLAIITGKIQRSKKNKLWSKKIQNKLLSSLKLDTHPSISDEDEKKGIFLFVMKWDEIMGPKIEALFPIDRTPPFDIQSLGFQLFQTSVSVYGHTDYFESQGVLLRIANIERDGYLFFERIDDVEVRGGKRQYMLVALAPQINYLESLRIKEILEEIGSHLKEGSDWDIEKYWQRIIDILTTPSIELS